MEELDDSRIRVLTDKLRIALTAHFHNAVPIARLKLSPAQKDMVARVEHVYWQYLKDPFLDVHALLYEMAKQLVKDGDAGGRSNAHHIARRDEKVFQFVLENSKPPSRKDREIKTRATIDRLMRKGWETDDARAMAKGAELSIRLDRLDQPESEHADMSRVAFLPSVVVINVSEVDDTKQDIGDTEQRRIMEKYGGYVDEKRKMIDGLVDVMMASGGTPGTDEDAEPEPQEGEGSWQG